MRHNNRKNCQALGCQNNQATASSKSFFGFPKGSERHAIWVQNMKLLKVTKTAKICQDHFEDDQFKSKNKTRLKTKAVPTILDSIIKSFGRTTATTTAQSMESIPGEKRQRLCSMENLVDRTSLSSTLSPSSIWKVSPLHPPTTEKMAILPDLTTTTISSQKILPGMRQLLPQTSQEMSVTYDFGNRNVCITGGSGGLGRAIVRKFLAANANVFAVDKDEKTLQKLKEDNPTVNTLAIDLTDWDATKTAIRNLGPIHHLVNAAGIAGDPIKFLELNSKNIDEIFNLNFKSMINVSQTVATGMIENNIHGTIVNISSVMANAAYWKQTLYCTSKAAVKMLTKTMALELAPHSIRVNSISPTAMATPMTLPQAFLDKATGDTTPSSSPVMTRFMQTLVNRQITPRLLTVEETAELILFLSSSSPTIMFTGEDILMDGGIFSVLK